MSPCFQRGQAQINFGSDSHHHHHLRCNHHHHHHYLLESNGHWPSKEQQGSSKKLVVHQHTIIYNCHPTIASYIIPPHHIIIIPYRTMPYHHSIIAPSYNTIISYHTIIFSQSANNNLPLLHQQKHTIAIPQYKHSYYDHTSITISTRAIAAKPKYQNIAEPGHTYSQHS